MAVIPVSSNGDAEDNVISALRQQLSILQNELRARDIREVELQEQVQAAASAYKGGQPTISTSDRQQFFSPRPGVGEWVADIFVRISFIERLLTVLCIFLI